MIPKWQNKYLLKLLQALSIDFFDFDETKKPTTKGKIVVIFPFSVSALFNQVQILFNGDN